MIFGDYVPDAYEPDRSVLGVGKESERGPHGRGSQSEEFTISRTRYRCSQQCLQLLPHEIKSFGLLEETGTLLADLFIQPITWIGEGGAASQNAREAKPRQCKRGKAMLVRIALISLLVSLPLPSPAWAGPISDAALGSQLAGGVVTVTRFGGLTISATFVADGTGASATALGSEGFTLTVSPGDTALATWTLTNTDLSPIFLNLITAVSIDLTFSGISLFDSGSEPSTPDSGPGIPGVIYVAGVPIGSATDLLPWPDPANLGDMFRAVSITFVGGIGAAATSSWMDDTDVTTAVPGPAGIVLIGTGLLLLIRRTIQRPGRTSPHGRN
jgi:hypothetical protein